MLMGEFCRRGAEAQRRMDLFSVLCGSMILCAYVVNLRKSGKGYNLIGVDLPHRIIGTHSFSAFLRALRALRASAAKQLRIDEKPIILYF